MHAFKLNCMLVLTVGVQVSLKERLYKSQCKKQQYCMRKWAIIYTQIYTLHVCLRHQCQVTAALMRLFWPAPSLKHNHCCMIELHTESPWKLLPLSIFSHSFKHTFLLLFGFFKHRKQKPGCNFLSMCPFPCNSAIRHSYQFHNLWGSPRWLRWPSAPQSL